LHTILCDILGIEHPIINAPMGDRAAGAELAAAVSAAGGFGMIGGSDSQGRPDQGDWLRDQIRTTRERTDRPFGVGFILSFFTAIPGQEDLLHVALQEQVPAVALSFGDPTP
jgi:nitronate monooxygenase